MIEAARAARGAGLLALTWVHSGTGVKIPAQEIAEAVRPTPVVLDGVHGLAADDLPIDSVDVLVAGTHKWLGGPRGTGLVWSRAWDRLRPIIPTFHPGSPASNWNPGGYHTFEHRWALAEAFDFHHRIGRTKVTKRIQSLATRLKAGPRRAAQRTARDADGRGGLGGHRVLRGRPARPADGGHAAAARAQDRRVRHALRAAVRAASAPACGSTRRTSTPR